MTTATHHSEADACETSRGGASAVASSAPVSQAAKSSWPVRFMLFAIIFGLVTCLIFTQALDGRWINQARAQAQLAIAGVLLLRLGWAVLRKEQGNWWMLYAAVGFAAAPLWIVAEEFVFRFAG